MPLDSCGADTQGAIGYQVQRAMYNEMKDWPKPPMVATVVTQVLVDRNDPSFKKPSQADRLVHGREADASEHREKDGWDVVEDAGRGWRRVVASPRPKKIIELEAIRRLLEADIVVVAVGGGGIPVVEDEKGTLHGRRGGDRQGPRHQPAGARAEGRPADHLHRDREGLPQLHASPTRRTSTA